MRVLNEAKMLITLASRAVAASKVGDGVGQLHFALTVKAADLEEIYSNTYY